MSASEAAELRAAAAEKAALLGAAEERLARLEALHRVAQVPTCPLHAAHAQRRCSPLRLEGPLPVQRPNGLHTSDISMRECDRAPSRCHFRIFEAACWTQLDSRPCKT